MPDFFTARIGERCTQAAAKAAACFDGLFAGYNSRFQQKITAMLTITLLEKTEPWLKDEASRRGIAASGYAAAIIEKALPKPNGNDATTALVNQRCFRRFFLP
jgi:hypothetical protein